jgi:hypothetical protein
MPRFCVASQAAPRGFMCNRIASLVAICQRRSFTRQLPSHKFLYCRARLGVETGVSCFNSALCAFLPHTPELITALSPAPGKQSNLSTGYDEFPCLNLGDTTNPGKKYALSFARIESMWRFCFRIFRPKVHCKNGWPFR